MRRLLVRAYPRAWRRRYGSEYAALLADLPLSPGLVYDALRGAVRERTRALDAWAPAAKSGASLGPAVLMVVLFWAAGHDMYRESDPLLEVRVAAAVTVLFGGFGALWWRARGVGTRALGAAAVAASLLAGAWLLGLGPVPDWRQSMAPGVVALSTYALVALGVTVRFVRDVRRELRAAAIPAG